MAESGVIFWRDNFFRIYILFFKIIHKKIVDVVVFTIGIYVKNPGSSLELCIFYGIFS